MEQQFTYRADSDPRQRESIRFLVRGGLLPAVIDDQFWIRLKFIDQASKLGLSVGDIRRMLAADQVVREEPTSSPEVERGAFSVR
jgi:DNA-binding transcriptional MerR regulator